jgi:RNA polymerase primary sigma factor
VPAVTQAKTPCIAQLANELGFASKPTLVRHLARIDELGPQIDPEGVYPQDWIVFRITGYRPDIHSPELVPGLALRADLSALAERISESAKLTPEDINQPYETIDSLTKRWSVSRKSIERYRRLGLIARRLDLGSGRRSVVFMRSAVEWFETINQDRLKNASRFERIASSQLIIIHRRAARYRNRFGWSRSRASARIASRLGLSNEGVRLALIRKDKALINDNHPPIFDDPGPTTTKDRRFALRCVLRGIEPSTIAKHTSRSHNVVLRAINTTRADLLDSYALPISPVQHQLSTASSDPLGSSPATSGLDTRGQTELSDLISTMRPRQNAVVYEEQMRAVAYAHLLRSAGDLHKSLDRVSPSSTTLDEIETMLRWAERIKIELVRPQLHLILSTIEHQIGGLIDTLDPSRASHLLLSSIRVASDAIDRFDPSHAGRIAAPVGLAVTRFASRQPDLAQPASTGRAMRRIPLGHKIDDWTTQVTPWHRWLMLDARIEGVVNQLDERDRAIITRRYGLDGLPPITRLQLAELLDTNHVHTARYERVAIRNALVLARSARSKSALDENSH